MGCAIIVATIIKTGKFNNVALFGAVATVILRGMKEIPGSTKHPKQGMGTYYGIKY